MVNLAGTVLISWAETQGVSNVESRMQAATLRRYWLNIECRL